MEQSSSLKPFNCAIHDSEPICRFSKDAESKQTSFCVECIMDISKDQRQSLLNIDQTLDLILKGVNASQDIKLDIPPPKSLSQVVDSQDQLMSKLSQHILQQKEKVCKKFKSIQSEINEKIETTRDKILQDLDIQFNLYKASYLEFEKKIHKHFQTSGSETQGGESDLLTKDQLISKLNNCRNTSDLELKVKGLINEATSSQEDRTNDKGDTDKETEVLMRMKDHKLYLEQATSKLPLVKVNDTEEFEKTQETLDKALEVFLKEVSRVENEVLPYKYYSFRMDSNILTPKDANNLVKMIGKHNGYKTKKIFSKGQNTATQDFVKDWYFKPNVALVIKTNKGEKIGLFKTHQFAFHYVGSVNLSPYQFGFNLTLNKKIEEKYNIYLNCSQATNQGFGGGGFGAVHALSTNLSIQGHLCSHSLTDEQALPQSQAFGGGGFGGLGQGKATQFTVEEVEIHQLEWEGSKEETLEAQNQFGGGFGGGFGGFGAHQATGNPFGAQAGGFNFGMTQPQPTEKKATKSKSKKEVVEDDSEKEEKEQDD